jgi:hypothetical protein
MVMNRAHPRWNEAELYAIDRIASLLVGLGDCLELRFLKATTPGNQKPWTGTVMSGDGATAA